MESKELMIGDWMRHANGKCYQVTRIDGMSDGSVHFTCGTPHLWDYNNKFEPIPLTEEILEKNGFTKKKDGQWVIEKKRIVGCCGQTCSNTNPLVYAIWVDKGYMGVVNYHPEAHITKAGSYVHELQHVLRLGGIDKEIIIKEDEQ